MKVYLIDCNSYIYRFYYAIRGLSNSKGLPTNAIYGFTGMLLKILQEKDISNVVAVFDSPHPTKRHMVYEHYKANRPTMPDDLALQIPVIKEVIDAFGIHRIEMPGYEADDLLGTLSKSYSDNGQDVFILSGDKDMLQLVNDRIKIYDYLKDMVVDREKIIEIYGVEPERISDIMALSGDSTDNIPGVKGIGNKKAKELISMAGSIDALLSDPSVINNERIKNLILENVETIRLSKTLATLDLTANIDTTGIKKVNPDWDRLKNIFAQCDFKGYLEVAQKNQDLSTQSQNKDNIFIITSEMELKKFLYEQNEI